MFKKLMARMQISYSLHDPSILGNPARIHEVINTPYKVWFWGMYIVEGVEEEKDNLDDYRSPQDVITQNRGNRYEVVDTMAFILHRLGYRALVVMSGKDKFDMENHPDEYFVLIRKGNKFIKIGVQYSVMGANIDNVFVTEGLGRKAYGVFDWTGLRRLFVILPEQKVRYRLADDFDPIMDMP